MAELPKITHAQAEGVGQELREFLAEHSEWVLPEDELVWADAVQLVLRRAAEMKRDSEESDDAL